MRLLLDNGADVNARDVEFHATPLVWAAEHARNDPEGRDFTPVARLLIAAGSPLDWEGGPEPAEALLDLLEAWRSL